MNTRRKIVAAVIVNDGKVLIARRKKGIKLGGFWEFPGGKVEDGETPEKALEREITEELGASIRVGKLVQSVTYRSDTLNIELLAYRAELVDGELKLTDHDALRWVEPSQLEEGEFTGPDRPVVRRLAAKREKRWKV